MRGCRAGLPSSRQQQSREGVAAGYVGQGRQGRQSRDTTPRRRGGEWRQTGLRDVRGRVFFCSLLLELWNLWSFAWPPLMSPGSETAASSTESDVRRTGRCSGAVVGRVDTREYAGEDGRGPLCPRSAPVCPGLIQSCPLQVHLVRLMEGAVGFENIGTPVPPQRSLSPAIALTN